MHFYFLKYIFNNIFSIRQNNCKNKKPNFRPTTPLFSNNQETINNSQTKQVNNYLACDFSIFLFHETKSIVAMKIEEYVPKVMPIIKVKTK